LTPETSLGFEVCAFARDVLGIELLPWQEWLFIHGLELKPDGSYRFRTVLVLVARQNGKTTALKVLALWRLIMDGARMVLGTSTNLDYARESWEGAVELARGSEDLAAEFVWPERRTNGEQTLTTLDGARYKIGTATRRGGRSLSVDLLILDELREHRTWEAWSASSKTTNARPRGQRWALSNMGDDGSVVLNHLQAKALARLESGDGDDSLAIYEWSAPPGCDTADRSVWPMANPALGYTIAEETLASDWGTDSEDVFRTEVLCQRVSSLEPKPINPVDWDACAVGMPEPPPHPVFFLDASPGLGSASICVAGMNGGKPYLELADYRSGADWLVARSAELAVRHPGAPFAWFVSGAVTSLREAFKSAGIEPHEFTGPEMGRACGHLQKLVADRAVTHSGDLLFAQALAVAVRRDIGDDLWTWSRRKSGDISPLVSATGACWLLEVSPSYDLLNSVW
jgi:phage terminase large subunit-like protein